MWYHLSLLVQVAHMAFPPTIFSYGVSAVRTTSLSMTALTLEPCIMGALLKMDQKPSEKAFKSERKRRNLQLALSDAEWVDYGSKGVGYQYSSTLEILSMNRYKLYDLYEHKKRPYSLAT